MYDPGMPSAASFRTPAALECDAALFLDFDGTLATSSELADDVSISPELPELLLGLSHRLQGAVAVVTGRSLTEIDRYLAPATLPGAGLHGAEIRHMATGPIEASGLPDLHRLAGALSQVYCEDRQIGVEYTDGFVRVFFESAPQRQDEVRATMYQLATSRTLEVIERDSYIEARPHGRGKGVAMRMLIEDSTFRGRRPVFIGNGATDEAGFRTASAMGGFGIKIGVGETAAAHRLSTVGELHSWLSMSLNALS